MKKYFIIAVFLSIFSFFTFTHAVSAETFTYLDTNNDAKVDTVRWTTSINFFTSCTYSPSDWNISNSGSIGITSINGISCSQSDLTNLYISVTASPNITGGPINPVISYTNNSNNLVGFGFPFYFPSTSGAVEDGVAPKILSVSPTNGSSSQSVSAPIIINFSEPMTIYSVFLSTSPSLTHNPSWSSDNKTVTYSHSNYSAGQTINASITNANADFGGSVPNLPYNWSFTTANTAPSGEIANSVYLDKNGDGTVDTIRWTTTGESIGCTYSPSDWVINNPGSIVITAITGVSCNNTTIMDISVTASPNITGGSTNPVISYTAASLYNLTGESGYFPANYNQSARDGAQPVIISVSPANGSTNQSVSTPIVINFTESMASPMGISISPSLTHNLSLSNNSKTFTYSHADYQAGQTINISIANAQTLSSSEALYTLPYNWSFTTSGGNNNGGGSGGGGGNSGGGGGGGSSGGSSSSISNMSLSINNSSPTTANTMAYLTINAIGATQMMVSNSPIFTNAIWTPYTKTMSWILTSGAGLKTVYVKFKDISGNISNPISASINLNASGNNNSVGKTYAFNKILNKRSPKQTIKEMQMVLNSDIGNLLPKLLYVDGSFGNKTIYAIKLFQQKNGLYVDGIPGKNTRAELSKIIVK